MALYNSAYAVVLPFIFLFTIPIAIFASFTTFLAFSLLLIRVIIIYIELALAIIPHYLFGSYKPTSTANYDAIRATTNVPRRKKRRTSSSSTLSATGTTTPIISGENLLILSQSIGPTRDFEGVGGWRLVDNSTSDDEGLWTNINSRLELPAENGWRHHRRSLTSGSLPREKAKRSYSPDTPMNTSKVRTPPSSLNGVATEYFPSTTANTSRGLKRDSSGATGLSMNSGSSSKASIALQAKQR